MRTVAFSASLAVLLTAFTVLPAAAAGTIAGTVTGDDGTALPCGVNITRADDGEWITWVECEPAGQYAVTDLAAGEYFVTAEVVDHPEYYEQVWDGVFVWDDATPVTVTDGQTTTGVDFVLRVGGTMTGSVRERLSGDGLGGAWVSIHNTEWSFSHQTLSEDDGSYTLLGIPPDSFLAEAYFDEGPWVGQTWDHALDDYGGTPLDFSSGETITDIDFDLLREAVINGRVQDAATGAAIADAYIWAHTPDYTIARDTHSDAAGEFRIGQLPPASYWVYGDADGFGVAPLVDDTGEILEVTVGEGDEVSGFVIELQQGGAIAGRVLRASDGSPVAYGYAAAWQPETYDGSSADTDEDGYFRIEGLAPGDYMVYAEGDWTDNLIPEVLEDDTGDPLLFHVEVDSEVTGLEFRLNEGGIVRGRVVAAEDGAPLAHAYVWAEEIHGDGWRAADTDDDGFYELAGMTEGDHAVVAEHPGHVAQIFEHAVLPDNATPVRVRVGEAVDGIDFHLLDAGRISGRVTDGDTGEPIQGVAIEAYFREDIWVPGTWVETDEDGRYELDSVFPGERVYVLAYDGRERYAWQWYDGALAFEHAMPIEVITGATTDNVDFVLRQPGVLTFSPSSLAFTGQTYQEDIAPRLLEITNTGPGQAVVDVWSEDDWLCVDYEGDSVVLLEAGETMTAEVTAWPWGLNAGTYEDDVIIANWLTGAMETVGATLTLTAAAPILEIGPDDLWFDGEEGGSSPRPEEIWLANLGDGEITFQVTDSADWLRINPAQGVLHRGADPAVLIARADISGLSEGDYSATINVATSVGDRIIHAEMYVAPPTEGDASIAAPERVTILIPGGLSKAEMKTFATGSFEIANEGDGDLYWSAHGGEDWIDVDPSSGTIPAGDASVSVTITADPEDLDNGVNSTFIEIGSSQETEEVEIAVQIGSEASTGAVEAGAKGRLVVPVLVHAPGVNESQFVSDLWISHRPSGRTIEVVLAFVPDDTDGTQSAITTRLVLESGQTISLLDVMDNWLGGSIPKGSLVIVSDDIDEVETSSRTYNTSKNGTFGQEIPGIPAREGITRVDGRLHIAGLAASAEPTAGFRSNLLLTEVDGRPVQVAIKLFAADGSELGTTTAAVKPFATRQINDIFTRAGYAGTAVGARAVVTVTGGEGRLVALGSTVDNITNDPNTLVGTRKNASVATAFVPVVANAPGVGGTQWVSDVAIANVDTLTRQVTVSLTNAAGVAMGSVTRDVSAGETLLLADVVGDTFDAAGNRGVLRIDADPVGGLVVSSRTYNKSDEGTFGQGIPATSATKALIQGSDVLRLFPLNNTERYRTNIGFSEIRGEPVRVGVVVLEQHGTRVLGYRELDVPANGNVQTNLFDAIGFGNTTVVAATAIIQVVGGDGGILAYASTVDNESTDATTLPPALRVPATEIVVPQGGPPQGPGGQP